jgi:exosortase/archaeosortase family protein
MCSRLNSKYPEAFFVTKLLLLFCIFYFGTQFWIGITAEGGLYSAFCDKYLNYIKWLRIFILKGAGVICTLFGYKTNIENTISLRIIGGIKVNMVYSCVGIGILSSWTAFVITFPSNNKRKLTWLFSGMVIICFINMIRVAALLMIVNKTRDIKRFPYHHELFNIVAYLIILLLIYLYTKEKSIKTHSN